MPAEVSPQDPGWADLETAEETSSLWRDAWHRLAKNRLATTGLWFVAALTLICFLGPLLSKLPPGIRSIGLSYSYEEQNLDLRVTPPGARHWLGTDQLGRDLLARLLFGGRVS